jgi:hypothetical protein
VAGHAVNQALERAAARVPGLWRLPVLKLVALGEVAVLAHRHITKLTPAERHRLLERLRRGRVPGVGLSRAERDELQALVAKAEPRLFATEAAGKLSPMPSRFGRGRPR